METKVKQVEVLPLIKYYMEALGLAQVFDKYVPNRNGMEIDPCQVLCLMVMNIMVSAKPLYRVEDWLEDYLDGVRQRRFEAAKYNDDRLGRNLDLLFEARPGKLAGGAQRPGHWGARAGNGHDAQ